jgi:hypothetical protein
MIRADLYSHIESARSQTYPRHLFTMFNGQNSDIDGRRRQGNESSSTDTLTFDMMYHETTPHLQ